MSVSPPIYTSRIQKGGALIPEMRQLVRLWTNASELGKVYSTAPEVAIGSDGKTYNTRQAKPAAHVVNDGRGPS